MLTKRTGATGSFGPTSFFNFGQGPTEAMGALQRELLEAYEEISRAWLARVQSEIDLWSQLATKLPATRSVPEAMQACQESMAQRMQMAAEDGRRVAEESQKIMRKITASLTNGSASGST